jgi:hypothetical protein
MHYEANKWLVKVGVLDAVQIEWLDEIRKQLTWTKGARHKINGKKLAESKLEIKARVGRSPDVNDGFVLSFARQVTERNWENSVASGDRAVGGDAFKMPDHGDPYSDMSYESTLYD